MLRLPQERSAGRSKTRAKPRPIHGIRGVDKNPYLAQKPMKQPFPKFGEGVFVPKNRLVLSPLSSRRYSRGDAATSSVGMHLRYGLSDEWNILSGVDYVSQGRPSSDEKIEDVRTFFGVTHYFH
jgi:hypothetical protein